jgi:hypothetical protein
MPTSAVQYADIVAAAVPTSASDKMVVGDITMIMAPTPTVQYNIMVVATMPTSASDKMVMGYITMITVLALVVQ